MMRKQWSGWIFLSVWFLCGQTAWADVIPPEVGACEQKAAGTMCEWAGQKGTCQNAKCTKNDYSDGSPPQPVEYDCLKCATGVPTEAPANSEPTPADGSAKEATPAKTGGCEQLPWPGSNKSTAILACFFLLGIWLTRRSRKAS